MRFLFLFFLLQLQVFSVKAQVFGGNRPSLRFYQLNTDTVRIIFPKSLEKEAREVAWLSHQLTRQSPAQLGKKFRKIDVVFQNQTTLSNGYVGMAPWRSEYYMMPDLSNLEQSSIPWHQTLAIHEFRHVEQFANFNRAIPQLLGFFLGQEGRALAMGAAVPDWFWEGDAVWQETVGSSQGRGRLPHFFNAYRSLWLDQKKYSFHKLRNGSYRHFVPNHYDLGYLLVSHGREHYGDSVWNHITKDALDFKKLVYPFQRAVQQHTGVSYKRFVADAFQQYQSKMGTASLTTYQVMKPITKAEKNNVVRYEYPFIREDGSVLALKTGYKQIPAWVSLDSNGRETQLRVKDISNDRYYSYRSGQVVYTAYEPDPRWGWQEYSVIKIWNTTTNEVSRLTMKSRLFMPDLSPDQQQVVAVHSGTDLRSELHLIATSDKSVVPLPNSNHHVYTYPRFTKDGMAIVSAVRNEKGEMAIVKTEIHTGAETILLPFSQLPIAYLQVSGDSVLFTAPHEQTDALFLLDLTTKEYSRLANLPNGNYQAFLNAKTNTLIWNTWSSDGTMLVKKKLSELENKKMEQSLRLQDLYFPSKTISSSRNLLQHVEQLPGSISRYSPAFRLLNIHSWRPTVSEPDYGITLFSENVLNTLLSEYRYNYNRNERSHEVGAELLYGAWYPVLSAGASQTWNRSVQLNEDTTFTWNQSNVSAGVLLPFHFTSGRTFKNLTWRASINSDQIQYTGLAKTVFQNDRFHYFNTSLSWVNQSQQARQHIYPRWAQTLRLQYRRTVSGELGNQFFANAGLYLPGFSRNHNLVLFASLQNRDTIRGSRFSNGLAFARGYTVVNFPRAWRLSANYHFPILYPELGVGNLIYIQRIRGNLFYDYTRGRSLRTGNIFPLRSTGMELFFDTKVWNNFTAGFGIRYSRLLDTDLISPQLNPNQFEFILPLDLF